MGRRKSEQRKRKTSNKTPPVDAVSSSSAASPPWIELPGDVTANILQRLGAEEILESAQKVCTTWRKVCKDPSMWRVVYLQNLDTYQEKYEIMCRHAVDLSQGQLVELSIEYFGEEETIKYICDRASNLKCLTLRRCGDLDGIYLTQVVKNLPNLEELHLTNMLYVRPEDVRAIGLNCPKLRSFSYNGTGDMRRRLKIMEYMADALQQYDYAQAISESMPNLRHLRLFAQCIQDKKLEVILDSCPHLESLDLRQCYNLNIGEDLGKRCREQIKDLRLPFDSTTDIHHLVDIPTSIWEDFSDYDDYDLSFDDFSDYDYEQYDDYTNPFGNGLFGDDEFFDDGYVPSVLYYY